MHWGLNEQEQTVLLKIQFQPSHFANTHGIPRWQDLAANRDFTLNDWQELGLAQFNRLAMK